MRKIFSCTVGLAVLGLLGTANATLITMNATLTADNHYALYYGNETGTALTFVGRNEVGSRGSSGGSNWTDPENFTFDVASDGYIYLAGWSDWAVAQGWIGQFLSNTNSILTNTSDWEVYLTYSDLNSTSPAPTVGGLGVEIGNANLAGWASVSNYIDNGSAPWRTIAGISSDADWIWGSALKPGSNYGEYQLFRTKAETAPVPEPSTMLLFGTGLAGLIGARFRKKKK